MKIMHSILLCMGVMAISATMSVSISHNAIAKPKGYDIKKIATLGDPAPGIEGGTFINDFEPGGINNHGDMAFGADVSTGGEGVSSGTKGKSWSWDAPAGPRQAADHLSSVSSDPSA